MSDPLRGIGPVERLEPGGATATSADGEWIPESSVGQIARAGGRQPSFPERNPFDRAKQYACSGTSLARKRDGITNAFSGKGVRLGEICGT